MSSNILHGSLLILFRITLFSYSIWLLCKDYQRASGLRFEKYTTWGEISTVIALFLLLVTAVFNHAKTVLKMDQPFDAFETKLYKATAFFYQWALLCELTLTFLFWAWIYGLKTDVHHMTWKDIIGKIHYDLCDDADNYNHSIPLLLLMIEFPVNNIVFTKKFLIVAMVINTVYIL